MMKSDRSVLSSMFRMTRYVTGMRNVSTSRHVMATYQVQSEEEFQQKVVNSKKPTVVDSSATWCGPCKLLTPIWTLPLPLQRKRWTLPLLILTSWKTLWIGSWA